MKKLIFALSVFISSLTHAESIGVQVNSLRGLNESQCSTLLNVFKGVRDPKISFLWSTFDRRQKNGFDCAVEFLKRYQNEESVMQIYATNSTCRRFPRYCEETEIQSWLTIRELNAALESREPELLNEIRQRARDIRRFLDQYRGPSTTISLVYALEDDFTNRAFKVFKEVFDSELPKDYILGRNPNGSRTDNHSLFDSDFIELHNLNGQFNNEFPTLSSLSNDGLDTNYPGSTGNLKGSKPLTTVLAQLRKFQRDDLSLFAWIWWNNQGIELRRDFIEPSKRKFKIDKRIIVLINRKIKK